MMQSIKHELWLIDEEKKDDEEHDEDEVFQRVKYNLVVAVQVMFDNHAQTGQLLEFVLQAVLDQHVLLEKYDINYTYKYLVVGGT